MDEQALLHGRFLIGLGHVFIWLLGVIPLSMMLIFGMELFPTYLCIVSFIVGILVRRHGKNLRSIITTPISKWL